MAWASLYKAYGASAGDDLGESHLDTVWAWPTGPAAQTECLLLHLDDEAQPVGPAHGRSFERPLHGSTGCYLDVAGLGQGRGPAGRAIGWTLPVGVSGCDVQRGKWRSYYDGVVTTDSTSFDIDHLVALAEAWDSGASRWTAATRDRYANDLGDWRSLVAVSASSNRSKSDRDPREWMPDLAGCTFIRHWVAVKIRWQLRVDAAEKTFSPTAQRRAGTG